MSYVDWEDTPEELVPVCCPNCCEDFHDVPLVNVTAIETIRLRLQIVLYGVCIACGESIACIYNLSEETDAPNLFIRTN